VILTVVGSCGLLWSSAAVVVVAPVPSDVSVVFEIKSVTLLCCSDSDSSTMFKSPLVLALVGVILGSVWGFVCLVSLVRLLEPRLLS